MPLMLPTPTTPTGIAFRRLAELLVPYAAVASLAWAAHLPPRRPVPAAQEGAGVFSQSPPASESLQPSTPLQRLPERKPGLLAAIPAVPDLSIGVLASSEIQIGAVTPSPAPAAAPAPVVADPPAQPAPPPAAAAAAAEPAPVVADTPARRIAEQSRPPAYPVDAWRRGAAGVVHLAVTVGADGAVTRIELDQSSGDRELDQAAVDAVRVWRYQPAIKAGRAVESQVHLPIRFRLP